MLNKKSIVSVGVLAAVAAFASAVPAFAEEGGLKAGIRADIRSDIRKEVRKDVMQAMRPDVVGKVTAVSGSTITVSGRSLSGAASSTSTFSVDASGATILRGNATSTVGNIKVGDPVIIQGVVTGTNVVAKVVRFAELRNGSEKDDKGKNKDKIVGDGNPVVAGVVSAISGNTVSITASNSIVYSVDATNAKVQVKGVASSTVSNIAVGDKVVAQGVITGNSVVATSIFDQGQPSGDNKGRGNDAKPGFIKKVGGWFKNLFGF